VAVGIAFQVLIILAENYSNLPLLAVFAFFIPLSFIYIIQSWKNTSQILAMKWNTTSQLASYEQNKDCDQNRIRNTYFGKMIYSYVNGNIIIVKNYSQNIYNCFCSWNKCSEIMHRLLSLLVFLICILGVLVSVAGVYYARYQIRKLDVIPHIYIQYTTSGCNAFVSMVYNHFFYYVAMATTSIENHRTDSSFNNSLAVKMILFQLTSVLTSFYYLGTFSLILTLTDFVVNLTLSRLRC
jgi:hypothetical protein